MSQSVLVADDDPDVLCLTVAVLAQAGLDVVTATDGREALALLRAGAFDLAVLDVRMPSLDGLEVLRRLRVDGGRQPAVLVLTTQVTSEQVEMARRAGADSLMARPFSIHQLLAEVRRLLHAVQVESVGLDRRRDFHSVLRAESCLPSGS